MYKPVFEIHVFSSEAFRKRHALTKRPHFLEFYEKEMVQEWITLEKKKKESCNFHQRRLFQSDVLRPGGVYIAYIVYTFKVTCQRASHEIRGEPSTEYSSGLPQRSAHGRLREHCPRFPCHGILQCWWSPYEMNDEKIGSLVHTLFIHGCQGSFTCLSTEHWVQCTL